MNTMLKILLGLLVSGCVAGSAMAQDTVDIDGGELQTMVEKLNTDIFRLDFLSEQIENTGKIDHAVLVFRQDDRSFRLLTDFNTLVNSLADVPEGQAHKEQLKAELIKLAEGVGDAIFKRINEIKLRISESSAELGSLSGGSLVAAQAYIDGLEAIRIRYYEALVNHLDGRKALGLSSEKLREQLDPKVYLYAETLAGRIELTAAALAQVQSRAQQNPDDADVQAALVKLGARHQINVNRLETMIPALDSLDLHSSEYKTVMLQHAGNISINFLSENALITVLKESWAALKAALKENAPDLFFRFLIFMAILFLFRIFSRLTKRVVRAASARSSLDMSDLLKNILVSTSGGTVMAIGVLMALSQVGISLAPMLAGLGVAGFIVGFALQDSLGNFAAGAMILIYRPFDVDDFVEVTGASGLVKKMNLVSTTIVTFDNQTLVVPNSKIWGDVIKNVTAQKERRIDMEFGIGYEDDIEHAERVFKDVVSAHDKVLKDPEPMIHLHTLGDSSVNFVVRPWVKTDDYWEVYWDIIREVKLRLDREGISIPFPQRDVHLYTQKTTEGPGDSD